MTCAKATRWGVLLILSVLMGGIVGCSKGSENYSSDLSQEVPKPRSDAPDFGEFKRTAPSPDGGGRVGK